MFPFEGMVEKDTEKLKGDIKGNAKEFWSEMEISWLELNMKISPNRVQIESILKKLIRLHQARNLKKIDIQ